MIEDIEEENKLGYKEKLSDSEKEWLEIKKNIYSEKPLKKFKFP